MATTFSFEIIMYNDGINNEFEYAHNKGLRRGFDLGWTYKGKFDREIISSQIKALESQYKKNKLKKHLIEISTLESILEKLKNHPSNKENIDINFW